MSTTALINATALHPAGCSDPNPSSTQYAILIENNITIPLEFSYVDSNCNDNILSGPTSAAGAAQVIAPGASQTLLLHAGSALVALEALNGGTTPGHVVAGFKAGAGNSTWQITVDQGATTNPSPSSGGSNTAAIAGGVVAGLVVVGLAVFGFFYWRKRYLGKTRFVKQPPEYWSSTKQQQEQQNQLVMQPANAPNVFAAPTRTPTIPPRSAASTPLSPTSNNSLNRPRRPSGNNSLGRPLPSAGNSLGRPLPSGNNSLGRPLPNTGNSLNRQQNKSSDSLGRLATQPTNKPPPMPAIDDYYVSEPVDPTAPGSRLRMRFPHTPELDDELRLNKGDVVEMIEAFEDGWCLVRVVMSGVRGVTKRGDEGVIPVGSLEIAQSVGQQRVMKNVKVPVPQQKKKVVKEYNGSWDEYTRRRNRESSLHSDFYVNLAADIVLSSLLTLEIPQRHFLFLHKVNFPFFADLSKPEAFGFAAHRCHNFSIKTPDNIKLGVWHVLPAMFYRQITAIQEKVGIENNAPPHGARVNEAIQKRALLERPVFLYFHGNAGSRASPNRIATYRNLSERLNANVIAIDYRGFGDSEGSPTEEGLAIDAKAIYDWIINQGVSHDQIILLGHSMGTGVAARLARDLERNNVTPRGLILQAAYTSIADAALEYNAFQVLPLLLPVKLFPQLEEYMKSSIRDQFRSRDHIPYLRNIPVLLIHGDKDREIPCKNSEQLFAIGVSAHRNDGTQCIEVSEVGVQGFRKFVSGTEEVDTGFESEGRRWVSVAKNGYGPKKIMLVELLHAHHNNVQAYDLTYDSIESFFEIHFDSVEPLVVFCFREMSLFVDPTTKNPMRFTVAAKLADHRLVRAQIEGHGGKVVEPHEKDISMRISSENLARIDDNFYSTKFITDAVGTGSLPQNPEMYRLGRTGEDTASNAVRSSKSTKISFTKEDDAELIKILVQNTVHLSGNKLYQELADKNPRHTAMSWRDRAVKILLPKLTSSGQLQELREEYQIQQQNAAKKLNLSQQQQQQQLEPEPRQKQQHKLPKKQHQPVKSSVYLSSKFPKELSPPDIARSFASSNLLAKEKPLNLLGKIESDTNNSPSVRVLHKTRIKKALLNELGKRESSKSSSQKLIEVLPNLNTSATNNSAVKRPVNIQIQIPPENRKFDLSKSPGDASLSVVNLQTSRNLTSNDEIGASPSKSTAIIRQYNESSIETDIPQSPTKPVSSNVTQLSPVAKKPTNSGSLSKILQKTPNKNGRSIISQSTDLMSGFEYITKQVENPLLRAFVKRHSGGVPRRTSLGANVAAVIAAATPGLPETATAAKRKLDDKKRRRSAADELIEVLRSSRRRRASMPPELLFGAGISNTIARKRAKADSSELLSDGDGSERQDLTQRFRLEQQKTKENNEEGQKEIVKNSDNDNDDDELMEKSFQDFSGVFDTSQPENEEIAAERKLKSTEDDSDEELTLEATQIYMRLIGEFNLPDLKIREALVMCSGNEQRAREVLLVNFDRSQMQQDMLKWIFTSEDDVILQGDDEDAMKELIARKGVLLVNGRQRFLIGLMENP
ncbi:hypothetical protein HK100_009418 [Physocladia obscura]|uniref:Telomeric repeat-binding factor 2-interacting protein 1 n=1 Tax=Physocladia obscura TaxID=109957 RepID=A0AAD5T517_9FUNG|nr:hypothetical protein HK100_009418 [Physocladia obscura]